MATVRYAGWRLTVESQAEASSIPEDVESISHSESTNGTMMESVIGTDERTKVDRVHFMPGGKYRCVVKLFLKYEKAAPNRWSIATGWLIAPDLVVTAGHCSYNWSKSMGRVVRVRAYIGYFGKASAKDPEGNQVQFRTVEYALTTSEWVNKSGQREKDVAIFKLSSPFNLTGEDKLYRYEPTPASGVESLGIVGYPGDLVDAESGERGAFMYESFEHVAYDLSKGTRQMLYYDIDTYGGNSGSAVIRGNDLTVSIGIHCYGGLKNHASAIGKYGNSLNDMRRALNVLAGVGHDSGVRSALVASSNSPWLSLFDVNATEPFVSLNPSRGSNGSLNGDEAETVSGGGVDPVLISTFKKALHQGKSRDFDKTPLGPIGPHLGALAGVALNAAGTFAKPGGTESGEAVLESGVAERAILGEAAIASIVKLGPRKAKEEGLFDIMAGVVRKIGPVVNRVAPKILTAVKDSALQIALNELNGLRDKPPTKPEAEVSAAVEPPRLRDRLNGSVESEWASKVEAFAEGFQESAGENAEFFGFLGPLVNAGLGLARGILESSDEGLNTLSEAAEAEADESDPLKQTPRAFDGLGARAVLGEAALEALVHMGPQKMHEEGLFDIFKKTIKTVGGAVLKHGPKVVETVLPIVSNMVGGEAENAEHIEEGRRDAEAENDFLSRLGDEADEGGSIGGSINDFPRPQRLFTAPLKLKYVTRDKKNMKIGEAAWELERPNITIPTGLVTLEIFEASGIGHINFPIEELRVSIGKAEAPNWIAPETMEFTDDSVVGGVLNWDQKAVDNKRIYIEVVGHPTHPDLNRFTIDNYIVADLQCTLSVMPGSALVSH